MWQIKCIQEIYIRGINMNFVKKHKEKILFILIWLVVVMFDYKYGKAYLDSDMASEMVLAKQLNTEGVLLSKNWYYSTELRIFGNAQLFRIFLLLFPNNWRLVRILSQSILILFTGLSYIYLVSILKSKRSIWFGMITMMPFGFWYMWHGIFDGFYLIWIILYNFCAGLIFKYSIENKKKITLLFIVFLSFFIGLQSVRGLLNLLIPLLLSSLLLIYLYTFEGGNVPLDIKRLFSVSLISCASSSLGYVANSLYLSRIYSYANQNLQYWEEFSINKINTIISDFLMMWGYPTSFLKEAKVALFSLNGLMSLTGIILLFVVVYLIFKEIKMLKTTELKKQIIVMTSLMSIAIPLMMFSFFHYENSSYFLPSTGLMIAGFQVGLDSFDKNRYKNLIFTLLFICIVIGSINTCSLFIKNPQRNYENQIYVSELLKEKGYTKCIGEFWEGGNVITELSNGFVESWVIDNFIDKGASKWLQSKSHFENIPKGKAAIIVSPSTCDEYNYNPFAYDKSEILYVDDDYIVLGVEDVENWFES